MIRFHSMRDINTMSRPVRQENRALRQAVRALEIGGSLTVHDDQARANAYAYARKAGFHVTVRTAGLNQWTVTRGSGPVTDMPRLIQRLRHMIEDQCGQSLAPFEIENLLGHLKSGHASRIERPLGDPFEYQIETGGIYFRLRWNPETETIIGFYEVRPAQDERNNPDI